MAKAKRKKGTMEKSASYKLGDLRRLTDEQGIEEGGGGEREGEPRGGGPVS